MSLAQFYLFPYVVCVLLDFFNIFIYFFFQDLYHVHKRVFSGPFLRYSARGPTVVDYWTLLKTYTLAVANCDFMLVSCCLGLQ